MAIKKISRNIIAGIFCLFLKRKKQKTALLLYHSINNIPHNLSISSSVFEKQLLFFKNNDFNFLKSEDLDNSEKLFNKKSVLITFDDGLEDNFTIAAPILIEYNIPAIFFIPIYFVGEKFIREDFNCMDWDQIRELAKNPLFEIGSHGLSHRKLTKLSVEEVKNEAEKSKEILEKELGIVVKSFAFPFGRYTKGMLNIFKDAGYSFIFTTEQKRISANDSLLELPRFGINDFSSQFFRDIFTGGMEFYWKFYNKFIKKKFVNNVRNSWRDIKKY